MSITDTSENSDALVDDGTNSAKVDEGLSEEADEDTSISMPEEGLGSMIGSSAKDLVKKYGEPARKDPSNYE